MIKKISFIGSGNTAHHLATAFKNVNINIQHIISRNRSTGLELAKKVNAEYTTNYEKLKTSDLIIICVNDDNIKHVISKIPNQIIAHTSGIVSMDILKEKKKYGVIYPLQSLTKNTTINFNNVPLCIEGSDKNIAIQLVDLSEKISKNVKLINSTNRQYLHLSAVFASNFTNYCYLMSQNIYPHHHSIYHI